MPNRSKASRSYPQPPVVRHRKQVQHRGEAPHAPRIVLRAVTVAEVIHAAQVGELLEAQLGRIAQRLAYRPVVLGLHHQGELVVLLGKRGDALAEHPDERVV
jgi:hypothetical protein